MSAADLLMAKAHPKSGKSKEEEHLERLERMPWVEKYRPKNLDEVSSQSHTVQVLQKNLQSANLPHMLFYGPPGTGKTSTILALAKQLYGPSLSKSRVLELNASDERGISIVREKIKNFARLSVSNPTPEDKAKYPCPPYKLIILDEADSMTSDAQSALRRTMETYSGITRFCLICNYITRIIDPLASRCSKFRFKSLDSDSALDRLKFICDSEGIEMEESKRDEVLNEILKISEGDLRKAITFLQSSYKLFSFSGTTDGDGDVEMADDNTSTIKGQGTGQITVQEVQELAGKLPTDKVTQLLKVMTSSNQDTNKLNKIFEFLDSQIFKNGYNATSVLNALHDELLLVNEETRSKSTIDLSLSLTNLQKNQISGILFKSDSRLSNGSDESIQVLNCVMQIAHIL